MIIDSYVKEVYFYHNFHIDFILKTNYLMNRNAYSLFIFLFLLFFKNSIGFAQVSKGGSPLSISQKVAQIPPVENIKQPDWAKIKEEDKGAIGEFRFAVPINVDFDLEKSGVWTDLPNGSRLWQLHIHSQDALGIAIAFNDFELPDGARLYVFSPDYKYVAGAFDADNNAQSRRFLAPLVKGDEVIIEYFLPKTATKKSGFKIPKIYHAYALSKLGETGFGASFPCQININCAQGATAQNQKRGVVRILMALAEGLGWCSGSLINNTKQDGTPYILTAYHCDEGYTPDHALWTFYFNYETSGCANPSTEPTSQSIQGCTRRAGLQATDFQLLEAVQKVPSNANAYFNGWNRDSTNLTSKSYIIHHPLGDIKKISTDNNPPTVSTISTTWSNEVLTVVTPPNSHINSVFTEGGMQPGSSGSPLFDANGRIIGQLHGGGFFECNVNYALSGWLAKSWNGGGTASTRLKDWLDPTNTGVLTLGGIETPTVVTGTTIAGKIRLWNGSAMANVKIYIGSDSTTTNATGDYSFSNIPTEQNLSVRFSKSDSYDNGVDAVDLVLIRRHILGITDLNSSYKTFCGDVDNSGEIDAADIVYVRRLILGINTTFPNTTPWRFVSVRTSNDTNFPFGISEPIPLSVKFTGAVTNFDFYAYKKGDVDGSADR